MGQGSFKHQYTPCIDVRQQRQSTSHSQLAVNSLRWVQVLLSGGNCAMRLAQLPANNYVAVKVVNKAYLLRTKQIMQAFNERVILALMRDDPFIVQCIGTAQDARNLYCVMEFEQGGDLFSRIYSKDRMDPNHAQFYMAEIVIAISHLHNTGCIYRDLKPENILLTSTGHVKLWNFGLSKCIHRGEKTYTTCGTPEYIAPEMIEDSGYDYAVDWWQVGILLYEMIAGHTPFADSDPYTLYERILVSPVDFPREKFSPAAKSLVSRLLSKDPGQRPHSQGVMRHRFFMGVDWEDPTSLRPPFTPELNGPEDVHYFENVEEEQDQQELHKKWQQMLFHGY